MEPVVVNEDYKIEIPVDLRAHIKPGSKYQIIETIDGLLMLPAVDIRAMRGRYPGVNAPLERDEDRA